MNHLKQKALAATLLLSASLSPMASAALVTYSGAGGGLPDRVSFSESVTVTETGTINNVSLSLNDFSHTWIGDFNASLQFNDGLNTYIVGLFGADRVGTFGSSADANGTYTFADGGTAGFESGASGTPIPSGTYGPNSAFAGLNGLSAAGNWTLNLTDISNGDSGSLGSWTLNLDLEDANPVPAPATLALFGLGLAGLGWSRRRKA